MTRAELCKAVCAKLDVMSYRIGLLEDNHPLAKKMLDILDIAPNSYTLSVRETEWANEYLNS